MASKAPKFDKLYDKKTEQLTIYVTREAKKKVVAAMRRGAERGRRVSASNVVTYCVLQAADSFDREAVADVLATETLNELQIATVEVPS